MIVRVFCAFTRALFTTQLLIYWCARREGGPYIENVAGAGLLLAINLYQTSVMIKQQDRSDWYDSLIRQEQEALCG